jgi:hypothetical protein
LGRHYRPEPHVDEELLASIRARPRSMPEPTASLNPHFFSPVDVEAIAVRFGPTIHALNRSAAD